MYGVNKMKWSPNERSSVLINEEICMNCEFMTDEYSIGDNWCSLVDEPIKYNESCKSFKRRW